MSEHEPDSTSDAAAEEWYNRKSALMGDMLGVEHDHVMHAIIPFHIGGGLDLYYYTGASPGTAVATKELSELPGEGPANSEFRSYELVMFTRRPLDLGAALDDSTPFGKAHASINAILNCIAAYSLDATLNPNETAEFPREMDDIGGRCVMFAAFDRRPDESGGYFGLLAVIELFRSEMKFARKKGGVALIEKLKESGHYPYSDMDRKPVA